MATPISHDSHQATHLKFDTDAFKITPPQNLPQRPTEFTKLGKETLVQLNSFNVLNYPSRDVWQYDVVIPKPSNMKEEKNMRVFAKKLWNSNTVKEELQESQHHWIFDGNKLAWSTRDLGSREVRVKVDLDDKKNSSKPRKPRADGKNNEHTLFLRRTRKVNFAMLDAFLQQTSDWSPECIDTINFLDHLIREGPSQRLTQIKKSFFQRGETRFDLGGGVEAFKGVFSSLRPVLNDDYKKSLAVNVDVANGTFWRAQELGRSVIQAFNCTQAQFAGRFQDARKDWNKSQFKKDLRRYRHVGVTSTHGQLQQWTIDEFVNMTPDEAKFPDPDDAEKQISLMTYFRKKYGKSLSPALPVVKMTKKIRGGPVYLPLEFLRIDQNQRYSTKLSDQQTSAMIKFAVSVPGVRWKAIDFGVGLLNWANDPYLKHYGLTINRNPSRVKARVLPTPTVAFGPGSREPKIKDSDLVNGRWRLDGRKFALPNQNPIRGWGVCVIQPTRKNDPGVPKDMVAKFFSEFIKIYEGHGGRIMAHPKLGKAPWMGPGALSDGGELVAKAWNATGKHWGVTPSLIFFIVNDRNAEVYRRIKKSMDCRFGVVSQVLQSKQVMSCSGQYISNVCMKVNAKLGGCTTLVTTNTINKFAPHHGNIPTMVVGADVSHPAPGAGSGEAASIAAITVSQDVKFTRYWADVQTNGNRIEMITSNNIENHFTPMIKLWMQRAGNGHPPKRVMYIRDGVSEGQYAAVLEEEVADMKKAFMRAGAHEPPKFTVMIAGKRHHVRFFPQKGDKNGNPLPGTLVEAGVTHPFEFDFYMCSHVAIKGTARPIHYHCILNEGDWSAPEIEQFIFEHAYSYVRSTTPVSMHPAVYYAHLAADRARAHLNENPVSSGKKESKAKEEKKSSTGSTGKRDVNIPPLIKMGTTAIKEVMWYI
ncbi:Piwi-domain-containing protein [Periconia macrospinosa]|uniref:Piwi-domain-containing protein n=1 Tax=Periconia macrospinosa TaxID=97972 RepID=A0A2V1DEY4_9PLEO|nr:Piwi-domain-containing protein [Periconia macrospinosa]